MLNLKFLILVIFCLCSFKLVSASLSANTEVYGPENLLKTLKTPLNTKVDSGYKLDFGLNAITLKVANTNSSIMSSSKLYLPGAVYIGKPAEFIIKARPKAFIALGMADRDNGAKPIMGHEIFLGPDRKLVGVGVIPENGIYHLFVEIPIEGDLIGQYLYFTAMTWTKPDFSDLEIAEPITAEAEPKPHFNGVLVQNLVEEAKKGIKFVPNTKSGLTFPGLNNNQ